MTAHHLQGVIDSFGSEIFSSLTYEHDPSLDGGGVGGGDELADDASIIAAFSEIGGKRQPLLGRDVEYRMLKDVWERVSAFNPTDGSSCPSEVVAIHGDAGVGKSFLMECFRHTVEVTSEERGIFVSSKFDQLAYKRGACEPFYAIVSTLSDICKVLFAHMEAAAFLHDLKEVAGVDFPLLVRLVPALSREQFKLESNATKSKPLFNDDSVVRLRWACRRFLQVASCYTPLLLHFDDVQWADGDTMSLIRALLNDKQSTSIMFVFSYRDGDESTRKAVRKLKLFPSNDHSLKAERSMSSMTTSPDALPLFVTDLRLGNLKEANVHGMLSTFLNLENPKAEKDLRHLVFVKTQGNPFFVLQFLERLKLEGLLRFRNKRWDWNYLETMMRLNASEDGLLASIDAQVHKLPVNVRSVLVLAAHLGFRFRRAVLETVVLSEYRQVYTAENAGSLKTRLDAVLETAENASVLIKVDQGQSFSFVHDRVLQCAYDMVEEGEMKCRLYLNLGQRLLPMLKEDGSLLFLVADILNSAKSMIATDDGSLKSELVRINKRAAEAAMNRAAYRSAVDYLLSAIDLLGLKGSAWTARKKEDYDMALVLHNQLALSTCNCGEFDACQATTKKIFTKARTLQDKQVAHLISIHASTLDGKYSSAVTTGKSVLKELGGDDPAMKKLFKKPKKKKQRVFRLLRTRRSLLSTSHGELLSLPKLKDSTKLATLEIMEEMSCARDHQLIPPRSSTGTISEIKLRQDELVMAYSLQHGWSPSTMQATAAFGVVELAMFDNVKRAAELGDLALEMISRYGAPQSKCEVMGMTFGYLFPWTRSWKESVQTLMAEGFASGMEHGKTYAALHCLALASGFLRFATASLTEAEIIIRENHDETKRFKISSALLPLTKPSWQMILNLKGRSSKGTADPVMLTGEVMDETKEEKDPCNSTPLADALLHLNKLELACHFGALDRAYALAKTLEENDDYQRIFKTMCPHFVSFTFWSGLTYLDVARAHTGCGTKPHQTPNRRRTLRRAKACRDALETVVENGCDDARPFYLILKADLASEQQHIRNGVLVDPFDAAVEAALAQGLLGYAGLACERAHGTLLTQNGYEPHQNGKKEGLQEYYSNRMFELYERWGAKAKVEHLRRRYGKTK